MLQATDLTIRLNPADDVVIARVEAVLAEANQVKRETVPASHLTLGLQCGSSDGYSGFGYGEDEFAPWVLGATM